MRIMLISDVHTERFRFNGMFNSFIKSIKECEEQFDILILAGDICNSNNLEQVITSISLSIDKRILFVPGNHEYYGSSKLFIDEKFKELENKFSNLRILNKRAFYYGDGYIFIGCNGWYESEIDFAPLEMAQINDFNNVDDIFDCRYWATIERAFLINSVEAINFKKICITHVPPFKSSDKSPFFGNNYIDIIKNNNITLWCYGHTHEKYDNTFYDTRIVSCPYYRNTTLTNHIIEI